VAAVLACAQHVAHTFAPRHRGLKRTAPAATEAPVEPTTTDDRRRRKPAATAPADKPEGRAHFIRDIVEKDVSSKAHEQIATRFPPEPNGFLHLGHAKSVCLNFGIARDYGGVTNLRLDDTNPDKEQQIFADAILDDVRWLVGDGVDDPWDGDVRHASDYFELIYACAKLLIRRGDAYVDSQTAEEMRDRRGTLTAPGEDSPFRERPAAESLALLEAMRNGTLPEGRAVLRAKIDMASPNLNLRDPALYRVKGGRPHPRTGDAWRVYPMYDFAHALSDAYEGITHSLCTLEFEDHRPLYDWVVEKCPEIRSYPWTLGVLSKAGDTAELQAAYRADPERPAPFDPELDAPPPRQIEFSRLNLAHTLMSKRKLAALVDSKQVAGWDDPRLPTLSGLRRKGVPPAALRLFCERVGVSKTDSTIEAELLDDCVREALDATAPRAFGVLRPLEVVVEDWDPEADDEALEAPRHPKDESLGRRDVRFGKDLYIERTDFHDLEKDGPAPSGFNRLVDGGRVRLRYAYVVACNGVDRDAAGHAVRLRCSVERDTKAGAKGSGPRVKGIVHWLRKDDAVPATVRLYGKLFADASPTGDSPADAAGALETLDAFVERDVANAADRDARATMQLERLGYFAVDAPGSPANAGQRRGGALVLNRCAPLKDTFGGPKRKSAENLDKKKSKKEVPPDLPADEAAAARLELLVGRVLEAEAVADSDQLYKTLVDVGEAEPRTVGAGLREHYGAAADLVGLPVLVLANTKPRKLAGFASQGMLLAATDDGSTKLVAPPPAAAPGARAAFAGLPPADPATPNQMNNKKLWPTAQASLSTKGGLVVLGDRALEVDGVAVAADVGDGGAIA